MAEGLSCTASPSLGGEVLNGRRGCVPMEALHMHEMY